MERVWEYPRPPAVAPCARRVRVELAGAVLADSTRALRGSRGTRPAIRSRAAVRRALARHDPLGGR